MAADLIERQHVWIEAVAGTVLVPAGGVAVIRSRPPGAAASDTGR